MLKDLHKVFNINVNPIKRVKESLFLGSLCNLVLDSSLPSALLFISYPAP